MAAISRSPFINHYRKHMFACHLAGKFAERNTYCRALGLDVIQVFYLRPEVRDELN